MGKRAERNLQDVLKAILTDRNWTYKEFGKRLGLSLQAVSDKINKRSSMSVAMLIKYCEAMDCEVVVRSKLSDRSEWVIAEALKDEDSERKKINKANVKGV